MTDRIITLGTADASLQGREAATTASLQRRLSALERTNYQPPVGTIFQYAAQCTNAANDGLSADFTSSWFNEGSTVVRSVTANTTQLAYNAVYSGYSYANVFPTATQVATGGGYGISSTTYPNFIALDTTYLYYISPSNGYLYRTVNNTGPSTQTALTSTRTASNAADFAISQNTVATRHAYVVGLDGAVYRTNTAGLGTGNSWITYLSTATLGWSASKIAVASATSGSVTAGDLFLVRAGTGEIYRYSVSGATLTLVATASAPVTAITTSDSHLYWATASGIGRCVVDGTSAYDSIATVTNITSLAAPPSTSSATTLYYTRGTFYIGVLQNAETAGNALPDAPDGYVLCDGTVVSREIFSGLFEVIGTTYGAGDGTTTFALPDFRGRVPVGGNPAAISGISARSLGATGGGESRSLTASDIPTHTHNAGTLQANSGVASDTGGGTAVKRINAAGSGEVRDVLGNTGNGNSIGANAAGGQTAVSLMQPFAVVNYIIKY